MSFKRFWWTLVIATAVTGAVRAQDEMPLPDGQEKVQTNEGTFLVTHASPATAEDIQLPQFADARTVESFTYRVKDRKKRDVMFYARVLLESDGPAGDILDFYLQNLGAKAQRYTKKATGETFLSIGGPDHFRLVVISPLTDYTHIRLERMQRITYPPRVYTEQEQRVLRVAEDIAAAYRTAPHVAYSVAQQNERVSAQASRGWQLQWKVDFTRPDRLAVTATRDGEPFMAVVTRENALIIDPDSDHEKRIAIGERITDQHLDQLSLDEDVVARMMVGSPLITPGVDYLAILPAPSSNPKQMKIVLTYPEREGVLHVFFDVERKLVIRTELTLTGQNETVKITRRYDDFVLGSEAISFEPTNTAPPATAPDTATPNVVP